MRSKEVSIDVMVPSCPCCSAKLEQELTIAPGVSKAGVRFVVPLKAQLRYDPTVARITKIVDALKEHGYDVALDRVEFRIPFKPLMPPEAWKVKVAMLSEKVEGIVSASVDFASFRIVVDYLPNLVSPKEIREAVVNWGTSHPSSLREGVNRRESSKIYGGGAEPERVQGDNLYALHCLGPGVSRLCHDKGVGRPVAGV